MAWTSSGRRRHRRKKDWHYRYFAMCSPNADAPPCERSGLQRAVERLLARIVTFPIPTVAAIDGHFVAAGAMLGLAFDARIVSAAKGWSYPTHRPSRTSVRERAIFRMARRDELLEPAGQICVTQSSQ